jgi:cytochrome o ubiquinol oxidase operon protein cyoD
MRHEINQPDFGMGKKKLEIYVMGLIICSILTLIAFGVVMKNTLPKWSIFTIIYSAACMQFLVQLICFLRLNIQTKQGQMNVMSILFTIVILITIIMGSLWIMWNLNYYMMYDPVNIDPYYFSLPK